MAPTSAKLINKTIYEGVSIIALGATTLKNGEYNFSLKKWIHSRQQVIIKPFRDEV
jgi:hypothetical protein